MTKEIELVLRPTSEISAIVPKTLDEVERLVQLISASQLVPKSYFGTTEHPRTPEQVLADVKIAVLQGLEVGLAPLQAIQAFAIINGRPTLWGDHALALVRASGFLLDFWELDAGECLSRGYGQCRARRRGQASEIVRTFTVDDAKAAGLLAKPGPWQQYRGRMLQMRARSLALRDGFADVLRGVQIREEIVDVEFATATVTPDTVEPRKLSQGTTAANGDTTQARHTETNSPEKSAVVRIDSAEKTKTGNKNGKTWNLYRVGVVLPDGSGFVASCFDDAIATFVDKSARIAWTENEKGKTITTIAAVEELKQQELPQ